MSTTKKCPQCGAEYGTEERFCPNDGVALRGPGGAADLVGQVVADRYHVLKKIGEGGMGQVYLAEHVRIGRRSALKVMHPGMMHDADAISRFNREAANAARISHPNVAAIYDFGETPQGLIYLAMEFVEGEPLTKVIEREGALPPLRAAAIVAQIAGALAAAHEQGIVHRDLKPDNVMVCRGRDGADVVKVVDFGIAKASEGATQKVTKTGLIVGTPEYMSPEQLAGDALDARSDIYSLGLVAFNALTASLPFPSATAQATMMARLLDRPRTLAEMRPAIVWPAPLQSVMDRVLARDAAVRYANAPDFARDLARVAALMPAPAASDASTQLLTAPLPLPVSLPPTRVAAAPGATITPNMPAVAPATPVAQSRTRRRTPLAFAGLGLLVAVAGGVAIAGLPYGSAAPPDSAASIARATPASPDSGPGAAAQASPRNDGRARPVESERTTDNRGGASAPSRSSASAPVAGTGTSGILPGAATTRKPQVADPRAELDRLARLTDPTGGATGASQAVAAAGALLPRLTSRSDSVRAIFYLGQAYVALDDEAKACETFNSIATRAGGTSFEQAVKAANDACP